MLRFLRHAPVVEALLTVSFDSPGEERWKSIAERAADALREAFPEREEIREVSVVFAVHPDAAPPQRAEVTKGVRLVGQQGRAVVSLLDGSMSVHLLRPYHEWAELVDLLDQAWASVAGVGEPLRLTRLSTRFVNHIRMNPGEQMNQILTLLPPLVEDETAVYALSEWSDRVVASTPDRVYVVVQRRLPGSESEFLDLLLDIEASTPLPVRSSDNRPFSEQFSSVLRRLREEKNRQFYGALTPEAINAYDNARDDLI